MDLDVCTVSMCLNHHSTIALVYCANALISLLRASVLSLATLLGSVVVGVSLPSGVSTGSEAARRHVFSALSLRNCQLTHACTSN